MRWSFLGGVVFRGRYVRQFLMWVDKPLAHYQIVDLEDIVSLLMYGIKTGGKRMSYSPSYGSLLARVGVAYF